MTLEGKVCLLHPHGPFRSRHAQPEIGIIEHLNRKVDRLRPEVDHQSFALEFTLLVGIHLDALSAAVNFLGDDAALGECVSNLFKAGIKWDRRNVNGRINALFLGFLRIILRQYCNVSKRCSYHSPAVAPNSTLKDISAAEEREKLEHGPRLRFAVSAFSLIAAQ